MLDRLWLILIAVSFVIWCPIWLLLTADLAGWPVTLLALAAVFLTGAVNGWRQARACPPESRRSVQSPAR